MSYSRLSFLTGLLIICFLGRAHAAPSSPEPELMLWVKAEDLTSLKEADRVSRWPDASGAEHDLKAEGEARPLYRADGLAGRPAVVFASDPKGQPPVKHSLSIPLSGEWSGATIFAVGSGLGHSHWFDTMAGLEGNLRAMGWVQLTGNKLGIDRGFPDLAAKEVPGIASMRVAMESSGAMRLQTFANGKEQGVVTDPSPRLGVNWNPARARLGTENWRGAVAELLIYKGALTDAQREQVEKYLSAKYGITADPAAPKTPWGFSPAAKATAVKPAPVTVQPVREGLTLWLRADELTAENKVPVEQVPNAVGGEPATSEGVRRPSFVAGALNGRGVLRFYNDAKTPRDEVQHLKLPASVNGERAEFTMLIAGRRLLNAGLFATAPGSNQSLRHIGPLQHLGSRALTLEQPFPWLRFKQQSVVLPLRDEGQIVAVTGGKLGETGQFIATYADGRQQARGESPAEIKPVQFRQMQLGTLNHFDGDIAEVLIYDRALTDAERQQSEKYLSQKWGVPLRDDKEIARLESARSRWSLSMQQLPNTQTWFGNTLSGREEDGWVQAGIFDITALPDGTIAAISVWDERHKEIGFYKDGKAVGGLKAGGGAITTDGKYLYAAMSGYGKPFTGVRRLTLDGQDAGWPDLPVADFGGWGKLKAIQFPTPGAWDEVRGLAVTKDELFVSAAGLDEVRVYDAASGAFKRVLPIKGAGKLVADTAGRLWAALPDAVVGYDAAGAQIARIDGVVAGGLAVDKQGVLWIADNGKRQQLIGFDINGATPREIKTFGEKGGVYSAARPGQFTDNRILPPKGLAIDAAGNFTVLGTNVMRTYAPDGKVLSTLEATSFTTASDFDPGSDGQIVYTGRERYDHVPGALPGRDWKLSGITYDHRRFSEFAEGGNQTVLRQINGHLLRYSPSDPIIVHRRLPNSDIFAPAAIILRPDAGGFHRSQTPPKAAPEKGRFAWSDLNENGLIEAGEFSLPKTDAKKAQPSYNAWIDTEGGIWEPQDREGLRYLPMQKMTSGGVPVYSLADEVWYEKPKEFMQVLRVLYLPRTDTMILTGTTWENPAQGTEHWGNSGREIVYYSGWKKGEKKVVWRAPFPEGALNIKAVTVAPATNLFFAGQMETMTVFVYDLRSGKLLGMVEPDKKLVGDTGWIDIDSGIRAFTRSNGEVLLLSEEVWGQKQMVYRIKPLAAR